MEFVCDPIKCGGAVCCKNMGIDRRVIIFPQDAKKISNHLNLTLKEFLQKYCYNEPEKINKTKTIDVYYLNYTKDKDCVFLENNLCSIHNFKPVQCKEGPINFLWTGDRIYECMDDIKIPEGFSTDLSDAKLFETLNEGYD